MWEGEYWKWLYLAGKREDLRESERSKRNKLVMSVNEEGTGNPDHWSKLMHCDEFFLQEHPKKSSVPWLLLSCQSFQIIFLYVPVPTCRCLPGGDARRAFHYGVSLASCCVGLK